MANRCTIPEHRVLQSYTDTTVLHRHQVGLEVMIFRLLDYYRRPTVVTYHPLLGADRFRLHRRHLEVITTCLPRSIVEDLRRHHSLGLPERSVSQGSQFLHTRICTRRICTRRIAHPSIDQAYLLVTIIILIQVVFHQAYLFRLWEANVVLMYMPHLLPRGDNVVPSIPLDLRRSKSRIRIQSSCLHLPRRRTVIDRSDVLNIGMQVLIVSRHRGIQTLLNHRNIIPKGIANPVNRMVIVQGRQALSINVIPKNLNRTSNLTTTEWSQSIHHRQSPGFLETLTLNRHLLRPTISRLKKASTVHQELQISVPT